MVVAEVVVVAVAPIALAGLSIIITIIIIIIIITPLSVHIFSPCWTVFVVRFINCFQSSGNHMHQLL
jgi:hypothetical protein